MNLEETSTSLIDAIKQRLGNPFLGSFFLSWPACNYPLALALVGDFSTSQKIKYVNGYVQTDHSWMPLVLWPAAVAAAYVLVYPFLDSAMTYAHRRLTNLRTWAVLKAEREQTVKKSDKTKFFKRYDQDLEHYKSLNAHLINAQEESEDALRRELAEVRGRLSNLVNANLVRGTGLAWSQTRIGHAADVNGNPLIQVKSALRQSDAVLKLAIALAAIRARPEDKEGNRSITVDQLVDAAKWPSDTAFEALQYVEAAGFGSLQVSGPNPILLTGYWDGWMQRVDPLLEVFEDVPELRSILGCTR